MLIHICMLKFHAKKQNSWRKGLFASARIWQLHFGTVSREQFCNKGAWLLSISQRVSSPSRLPRHQPWAESQETTKRNGAAVSQLDLCPWMWLLPHDFSMPPHLRMCQAQDLALKALRSQLTRERKWKQVCFLNWPHFYSPQSQSLTGTWLKVE